MNDRGYSGLLVVLLAFAGIVLTATAVELGSWFQTWQRLAITADAAARAGATALDPEALYDGGLVVDSATARRAAVTRAHRPGRRVRVVTTESEVCISLSEVWRPRLLRAAGIEPLPVRARACASPTRR